MSNRRFTHEVSFSYGVLRASQVAESAEAALARLQRDDDIWKKGARLISTRPTTKPVGKLYIWIPK